MNRYFKIQSKTYQLTSYIAFENDDPTRQVNVYDGEWRWASFEENRTALMDQPLSRSGILPEEEITSQEFENAWHEAHVIGQKQSPNYFSLKIQERRNKCSIDVNTVEPH